VCGEVGVPPPHVMPRRGGSSAARQRLQAGGGVQQGNQKSSSARRTDPQEKRRHARHARTAVDETAFVAMPSDGGSDSLMFFLCHVRLRSRTGAWQRQSALP